MVTTNSSNNSHNNNNSPNSQIVDSPIASQSSNQHAELSAVFHSSDNIETSFTCVISSPNSTSTAQIHIVCPGESADNFTDEEEEEEEDEYNEEMPPLENDQLISISPNTISLFPNLPASQLFKVTIKYNKHIWGFDHYFAAAGIDHQFQVGTTFQPNPEYDFSCLVYAANNVIAVMKLFRLAPFFIYTGCKYREIEIIKQLVMDPANFVSSTGDDDKPSLLAKFFAISEVSNLLDLNEEATEGDPGIYDFQGLELAVVRAHFNKYELALLDVYAESYLKYYDLCTKLYGLFDLDPEDDMAYDELDFEPFELKKIAKNELKYGSIVVTQIEAEN